MGVTDIAEAYFRKEFRPLEGQNYRSASGRAFLTTSSRRFL